LVLHDDVPALLAEVAALTAERDEARRLLEGLTPGGSEFYANPQRCAEWARQRNSNNMDGRVEAVAARNKAEAALATGREQVAALRGALLGLRSHHATDCSQHFHSGLPCSCGATKQNAVIDAALAGKEASDAK
jgi:hypothetical protein